MDANAKRRVLLAKIHVARKQLGMEEDTYREFLKGRFEVDSCRGLEQSGLERVLAEFRRLGWRDLPPRGEPPPRADDPQSKLIRFLWLELHRRGAVRNRSESALLAFVNRMTGQSTLLGCNPAQRNRVIEELKSWLARTA